MSVKFNYYLNEALNYNGAVIMSKYGRFGPLVGAIDAGTSNVKFLVRSWLNFVAIYLTKIQAVKFLTAVSFPDLCC